MISSCGIFMFLPRAMSSAVGGASRSKSRIHERVVEHHVGAPEQFRAAQREQARVARSGADKINRAFGFHALSLCGRRIWAMKEEEPWRRLGGAPQTSSVSQIMRFLPLVPRAG